jgi:hypothetical protein
MGTKAAHRPKSDWRPLWVVIFQTWKRTQSRSALSRQIDIRYRLVSLSEINSSISARFRSAIDNAIMALPSAAG